MTTMNDDYTEFQAALCSETRKDLRADGVLLVSVVRGEQVMTQVSQDGVELGEMIGIIHLLARQVNAHLARVGLNPAFTFNVNDTKFFTPISPSKN
ncbi:hypothetical protein F5984_20645 [Rudanella paleaurantiibacter]|uniref:Uncharacterized protein n=1 Tax=Rudanella paleaurantiibacter TaxID=2614655 RepID=A0A7J5TVP9_9BACT|nr:hypothetical protein [Rudanella paleaurantiibacter]KAB7728157.1 hypothetical protein F5984_20645 [Rudanella paleaurantiibacter]